MTEENPTPSNSLDKEMKGGETIKMKKRIRNSILIAGFVFIVALLLIFIGNQINANAIKEKQAIENYTEWLAETCNCLERNIISCSERFELKNNICTDGEYITNKLLICSKYNCSGEIKLWNNKTEKWE